MTTKIENTASIGIKDKLVTSANAGELSDEELERVAGGVVFDIDGTTLSSGV